MLVSMLQYFIVKDELIIFMKIMSVNMFGEFSISYGENKITEANNRKKKVWSLLQYLIAFRSRDISQEELIEMLWPDDNVEDPANTLKTLMYRVREVLKTVGIEDVKKVILAKGGTYAWNIELPFHIDVDDFESLLEEAATKGISPSEKLEKLLAATEIYKGDYLIKDALASWIVPISTYYRSQYLKVVSEICEILAEQKRYDEMVTICQKAVVIDPYEEFLHYSLLSALIKSNKQQQALSYYYYVKDLFYSKFGINLSDEFKALYKETIKSSKLVEHDLSLIMESLHEVEMIKGSFYCEYEFFKDIYRLEIRAAERTGMSVYMCLLTIGGKTEILPSQRTINNAMDQLNAVIKKTLRKGDVFTRYSVTQYLLMLPMTTFETATMVIERIVSNFKEKNTKSPLVLHYSHQAISPLLK
jgi:DNA-binding SARP family transcriptional activator